MSAAHSYDCLDSDSFAAVLEIYSRTFDLTLEILIWMSNFDINAAVLIRGKDYTIDWRD